MDRLVITIRPSPSDERLLRVDDAMQQVIDAVKIYESAERALASPNEAFDWRLESATTNSPFTIVALAEPRNPSVDVSAFVDRVKNEVSRAVDDLVTRHTPASWMGPDEIALIREVFQRNTNGIGATEIDLGSTTAISIDKEFAAEGLRRIEGMSALTATSIEERVSYGEIEGIMLAAGRYRNQPSIQIRTEFYGFVWCVLSKEIVAQFGGEHAIKEVWDGRNVGVEGRLYYAAGGRLSRIEALTVREIVAADPIDLDAILDPNFTAGLDPHEYLRQLHDGELA